MEMGLGKTVSTLTAISELIQSGQVKHVLVVAPLRVTTHVWPDELAKWDHLKHLTWRLVQGPSMLRAQMLHEPLRDITLINYELLPWLTKHPAMTKWPFDMLILDESSAVKNPKSVRFRTVRSFRKHVKRCVLLTGTPASNGLMDLWAPIYLLDRGQRLGSKFTGFRDRWFQPKDYKGWSWALREGADTDIHNLLGDVCLSMKSSDYLDLPEKIINDVFVDMDDKVRALYKKMKRDLVIELENGTINAANAAIATMKLLQIASGAVYGETGEDAEELHVEKFTALEEILDNTEGEPLLVFCQWRWQMRTVLTLPGATMVDRPGVIEAWNKGKVPILVAHPASAGHGLNLQHGGRHVVWMALPWALDHYEQANARLHRQGQTKPVMVHRIMTRRTLDEAVALRLQTKCSVQDALMQSLRIERKQTTMNASGNEEPR
jgi:SNF2 family DNA or RNA helicase